MISSGVAGPLGALHLPRLWLKVSLEAAGKLAAGYPGLGKGYDQMTCDALGLDAAAVVEFVKANKPTYPAFEAWVRKNGKKLTKSDIHRHNLAILGYCHDDATRGGIANEVGLVDHGDTMPPGAIDGNNVEDWKAFHTGVLKEGGLPAYAPGTEVLAADHTAPVAEVSAVPAPAPEPDPAEVTHATVSGGDVPPVTQS
jgi:hypothetical protein